MEVVAAHGATQTIVFQRQRARVWLAKRYRRRRSGLQRELTGGDMMPCVAVECGGVFGHGDVKKRFSPIQRWQRAVQ